jgi:hypothetical protein
MNREKGAIRLGGQAATDDDSSNSAEFIKISD